MMKSDIVAIAFTSASIVVMFVYLFYDEKKNKRARDEILTILRESKSVMSVPDIVYIVEQAGIIIDNDDAYRFLDSLCESNLVRCHKGPEYNGKMIKSHGTYAIDTISDYSR